jgi:hypothetical protein
MRRRRKRRAKTEAGEVYKGRVKVKMIWHVGNMV